MITHDVDGRLEPVGERWQLRFSRRLAHPPAKVWRALTEPDEMAAWFPTQMLGSREVGASLTFVHPFPDAPTLEGEILVYDPPSTLAFTWGNDTFRFELAPDGDGCLLTLLDTFDALGKAARDAAGWHTCLDQLGYLLDNATAPFTGKDRWSEVHPAYQDRFGPEASTIGPPDWHELGWAAERKAASSSSTDCDDAGGA